MLYLYNNPHCCNNTCINYTLSNQPNLDETDSVKEQQDDNTPHDNNTVADDTSQTNKNMPELGEAAEVEGETKVEITDKPEEIKDDSELGNNSENDDKSDDLNKDLPTEGDELPKVCLMKLINLVLNCLIVLSKDEVDKNNEDKNEDDHKSIHVQQMYIIKIHVHVRGISFCYKCAIILFLLILVCACSR